VKASLESLWNELIPTDSLVDMTNGLAGTLDVIAEIVDAVGGFKTIMLMISTVVLNQFSASLTNTFNNAATKVMDLGTKINNVFNNEKGFGAGIKDAWNSHVNKPKDEEMQTPHTEQQLEQMKSLEDV
jgi:hypothetical protein